MTNFYVVIGQWDHGTGPFICKDREAMNKIIFTEEEALAFKNYLDSYNRSDYDYKIAQLSFLD